MLQTVASTLIGVIVPLSVPVAAGALLARFRTWDTKPLLSLYLYVLSPAIIYDTLRNAHISLDELYSTIGFALVNLLLMWGVAIAAGRLARLDSAERAGLTLISTLTNSANYGLPLVLLAFGQLGLDKASVYVITQMILVNTVGVYFAARSQFSVQSAVKSVFALPAVYAAALAVFLKCFGLHLTAGLEQGISMVADAYSPVVLTILGAQMVKVGRPEAKQVKPAAFWAGTAIRLLLAPLIAFTALKLLGISGLLFSVLFIQASMPVAVNAVVLAERFDAAPGLVSKCIVWTTLASFLALPALIVIVQALS
ncbi:AEC family transporter [Paenibacillus sp.]|jgi:malate permease and related proteins|uniref:AEC family transporter n=1 Tax=Paenibacillus sp. TaxID=58172 RepID=UPI0015A7B4DF|nr:AEC family transporter [Paenibacillus sp.]MDU2243349.1 AEC family transporter [Paenibacillus sp.]